MPLYEYSCQTCGETFDMLRSIRDDDRDVQCPNCGDKNAVRQMSVIASDPFAVKSSCGSGRPGRTRFG